MNAEEFKAKNKSYNQAIERSLAPFPRRVVIESPYAGNIERNKDYLRQCVAHSLAQGEAPWASHGFYPEWLDDTKPAERTLGMQCGGAWARAAHLCAVYLDWGISHGMAEGIKLAVQAGVAVDFRVLDRAYLYDRFVTGPHQSVTGLLLNGEGDLVFLTDRWLPTVERTPLAAGGYTLVWSSKPK